MSTEVTVLVRMGLLLLHAARSFLTASDDTRMEQTR